MSSKFSKKNIFTVLALVALVFFIIFNFFGKKVDNENFTVTKSNLVKEVLVAGKTKARSSVDLGFDKSGRVARVYYDVGDRVPAGSLIAELDMTSEFANLAKERATLLESEANTQNDSLRLATLIREGYRAGDNAIRNKVDQFFQTPRTNPKFEVKFNDGNFEHYFNVPVAIVNDLNSTRKDLEKVLIEWQGELALIDESNAKNYSSVAISRLNKISDFLSKIAFAVNEFTPAKYAYEGTVEGYKTTINSARSEVSTAQEAVIGASSNGASSAKINQIKASIASLEAELQGSKIFSPFTGVITKQDAKVGGIVAANSPIVSVISDYDMYIEADVSEVNIGKIALGNNVKIEFDALPEVVYKGSVSYIDPAETIIDGVVNYKIRVELEGGAKDKPEIKSGLTANLKVETAQVSDALALPNFTIIEREGKKFVNKIVSPKNIVEVEVETGIVSSDGLVEIKSGLLEGDLVEFVKE